MTKAEALKLILDLAHANIIDEKERDMEDERARQCEAFDIASQFIHEEFGDDPVFNA